MIPATRKEAYPLYFASHIVAGIIFMEQSQ